MRKCRKLISMLVMMAMLATMTPYQALAAEVPTDPNVELSANVVEQSEQNTDETAPGDENTGEEKDKNTAEGEPGENEVDNAAEGKSGGNEGDNAAEGKSGDNKGDNNADDESDGKTDDATEGASGSNADEIKEETEDDDSSEEDASSAGTTSYEIAPIEESVDKDAKGAEGDVTYSYTVTFQGDPITDETIDVRANYNYEWLTNVAFLIYDADNNPVTDESITSQYELRVNGVTSSDTAFTWDGADSYTLADENDVTYTISLGLYNKESDEQVSGPHTVTVKTQKSSELKNMLDVDDQYITKSYISDYYDGTGPFDDDNAAGNDSDNKNDIVRSFDHLNYQINVASDGYSEDTYKQGYVGYLMLLAYEDGTPIESDYAQFDEDTLAWMTTNNSDSELNRVINGTAEFTVDGETATYKYVKGYHYLNATDQGESSFPIASATVNFSVHLGGLGNGTKIKPLMWTWIYPNDVDLKNLKTDYSASDYDTCDEHSGETDKNSGKELVPVDGVHTVTVSAAPHYNVLLNKSYDMKHYKGKWDFNTGNSDPSALSGKQHLAPNYGIGIVEGYPFAFAVTIQLYNTSSDKGLKGIEIPEGPITFEVNLSETFKSDDAGSVENSLDFDGSESGYTPLLWSWKPNASPENGRPDNRDYFGSYNYNTWYAAPKNKGDAMHNSCYDGGDWTVTQEGATLTFTAENYTINSDWFPNGNYPIGTPGHERYWVEANGIDTCYIGCFSSCDFYVIAPVVDIETGENLLDHKDSSDNSYGGESRAGNLTVIAQDCNLSATSITGQSVQDDDGTNSAQQNKNDDKGSDVVHITDPEPGKYDMMMNYTSSKNPSWNRDASGGWPGALSNGRDVAENGQAVAIEWQFDWDPKGYEENCAYGINALLKFDDEALSLDTNASSMVYNLRHEPVVNSRKYLFAAKKDGSGWTSDEEMNSAVEEDLVYYATLEELEADGKICVGILAESRMNKTQQTNYQYEAYVAKFVVKEDAELMGNVYQTCESVTFWTYQDYLDQELTSIPSRLDVQSSDAEMPDGTWKDNKRDYTKTVYDENGVVISDASPGGRRYGDSLYIIPYTPKVEKYVQQDNSDGSRMTTFDLDSNQKTVDFIVQPKITKQIENPSEDFVSTTTVIMEDTLPVGVTYNEDAVLGGTYEQSSPSGYHGTITGGAADGEMYPYTDADGNTFDLEFHVEVTPDSSGTTTLTFTIMDYPIGQFIPIYYSVNTDDGASSGDKFTNSVKIRTSDYIPQIYETGYGNIANATYQVVRASSLSLSKKTDKSFVDVSSDIGYNMTWQNTGDNDYSGYPMFDVLPWNGDSYGTSFSGTYTLQSVTLTNNNGTSSAKVTDFSDLAVWYTTDAYIRDLELEDRSVLRDNDITGDSRWSQATVNADGTVTGISENATAFCILGPIKNHKMVQASCVISPSDNEPGDKYANSISVVGAAVLARGIVLNRIVSGLVWYDANSDGIRQSSEKKLSGIKVMLVTKEDFDNADEISDLTPATNLRDEACVLDATEADGSYEFQHLPAGEFVVLFLDESGNVLSKFEATEKDASDASVTNNSDADSVTNDDGTVDYGYIDDITMPTASEITGSPYRVRYEDMGLKASADITVTKVWSNIDGSTTAPAGAKVTFTLTGGDQSYEVELDGTVDDEAVTDSSTNAVYGETAAWTATYNALPRYTVDDQGVAEEIEYAVEETGKWTNYKVSYSDGHDELVNGSTATVTNTRETGNLAISKTVSSPVASEATKVFTFTVTLGDTSVSMDFDAVRTAGETEKDETVTFSSGEAKVKVAGGETLTIKGLPSAVTYTVTETTSDRFTVNPESAQATGTLEADATKTAAFTNTRKTGNLTVSKTVVSPIPAEEDDEFTFTVTLKDGDDAVSGTFGGYTFDTSGQTTVTVAGGTSVTIEGIPSDISYTVEEVLPDGSMFEVTDSSGTTGTITADGTAAAAFTNTRKTGNLSVTKAVVNKNDTNTAKEFNVKVTLSDTTITGPFKFGDSTITFTADDGATFTIKDGETKTIEGLPAGITYTVEETLTDDEGKIYTATYEGKAEDDESAGISGTVPVNETAAETITNTYLAKGDYTPVVKKVLNGRPLEEGQFTFELLLLDSEGNKVLEKDVKNAADGTVTFGKIEYDQDDMDKDDNGYLIDTDIAYTIKEVVPEGAKDNGDGTYSLDGYTYDAVERTVTVTLSDNEDGTITVTPYKEIADLEITNIYKATGQIELPALKKLLGERALEEGQFTFELKDEDGNVLSSKSNDADGNVLFDAIEYDQDDIYELDEESGMYKEKDVTNYTYTISEVIPEGAEDNGDGTFLLDGYTYDGTVYTIVVELTDNGDGTITAAVAGTDAADTDTTEAGTSDGTEDASAAETEYVFANAYDASGTLKLDAVKEFTYGTLKGGDFTFELKDADGNVLQSKTNDAAGNVSFEMLAYTMADLAGSPIVYTVSEVAGDDDSINYDETVYTVTVTLADNGDGTLSVTKEIDNGGELKFVNKNLDVQTSVNIGGVKVLKGKDLEAGQFTFVLTDESGKQVLETTNDAKGNFEFDAITYVLTDLGEETEKVFTYGVAEVNDGQKNITYDKTVYTVKVTVTNNGDGTMTATADKTNEEIKFTNTYNPPSNNTGDSANGALWAMLLLIAGGALAGIIWYRRKKKV